MTLEQLALLAEIIGGIAVLVTLIFLLIEVRRNTAVTRSSAQYSQVDSIVAVNLTMATDPIIAPLIVKANDEFSSLSSEEQLRLQTFYVNYFNLWHASYWNNREKLLNDFRFELWDKGLIATLVSHKACTEAWISMQNFYDEDFRNHVNALREKEKAKFDPRSVALESGELTRETKQGVQPGT